MRFSMTLIALLACSQASFIQPKQEKKVVPFDQHQNDPCGNPLKESMVWTSVSGRVVRVVDGDTLIISIQDKRRKTVHLVGIDSPGEELREESRIYLEQMALDTDVEVLLNPSHWDSKQPKPAEITGVVYIRSGSGMDANLAMIEAGMARYKKPKPYEMSNYSECRYKNAETKAREAKRGLWHGAV